MTTAALHHARSPRTAAWLRGGILAAGIVALVVGGLSCAAWWSGVMFFWSATGVLTVKTNMAVGQCLAGTALLLLGLGRPRGAQLWLGVAAAALVFAIGGLTLAEHVFRADFGIDQLLAAEQPGAAGTASPNRMGPPGASSLTLLGIGLLLLAFQKRVAVPYLGLAVCLINLVPATGFILGVPDLYSGRQLTGIAWPTVLVMISVGLALVLTRPEGGPLEMLLRNDAGGRLLRDMLPAAVLLPTAIGLARVSAQHMGLIDTVTGRGIFAISMTVVFVLLLWRSGARLSRTDTSRQASAVALRESEHLFEALASNAPAVIFIKDLEGRYRYANPLTCAIVGRPEGVTGLLDHEFLPAEIADNFRRNDRDVLASGDALHREETVDGRCFLSVKFPLTDADGNTTGVCGVAVDITERKRVESALAAKEAELELIAQTTPLILTRCSRDLRYLYLNNAAAALFNCTPGELVGRSIREVLGDKAFSIIEPHVQRVLRGECVQFEAEVPYKRGSRWIHANYNPDHNAQGEVVGWVASIVDITERKRLEFALQEANATLEQRVRDRTRELSAANAKFRAIYDQGLPAGLLDLHGTVKDVNRAFLDACGCPREAMVGKPLWETGCWERLPESGAALRDGLAQAGAGHIYRAESQFSHADGTEHTIDLAFIPVRDDEGELHFVVVSGLDITDRKRVEAELKAADVLRESEARFRQMADSAPVMIRVMDGNGDCTFVSKPWFEFTGQSSEEVMGRRWMNAIHPDDRNATYEAIRKAAAQREGFQIEYRLRRKDGALRWVIDAAAPRFLTDGRLQGYIGSVIDITERRLAERQRREAAMLLEGSIDALTSHIAILDRSGAILKVNAAWRRFAQANGFPNDTFGVGGNYLAACEPPSDSGGVGSMEGTKAARGIRDVIEGRIPVYEMEYACHSPTQDRWFVMRVTCFGEGEGLRLVVSHEDVTKRRRAEDAIRESEERFRDLADNMSQLAWMADGTGSIFWYNRRWFDYTGTRLEEVEGWGWRKVHHPEHVDRVVKRIQHSWDTGELWEDIFPLRGRSGQYRWFLSRAVPIRDETGRIVRWFGTHTDVTRQREIEHDLQVAKEAAEASSRAKDRFLAVLSHELRTPLTPVLMAVSAMEQDPSLPADVRPDIEMIRRNVELESKLIDDLLDLSRVATGKLTLRTQAVDLNDAVQHVCSICRSQVLLKGIQLHCELHDTLRPVRADPARLQQVLWNLIKNAVKFTPERGEIFIRTERIEGRARVQVRDTGIGIDRDSLPRIFDAFEQAHSGITRQFGGLGLGLAISKAIVDLHGGSLRAESDGPGLGSTFTLELPLAESAGNDPSDKTPQKVDKETSTLRILVVEDHPDTARVLSRYLQSLGHAVQSAGTVSDALAAADQTRFHLVISDIGLPDATGYDLMRALRDRGEIVGVAMSGYGMDEDVRRSREAGYADHLIKPVRLSDLEHAIRRLVTEAGRGERSATGSGGHSG